MWKLLPQTPIPQIYGSNADLSFELQKYVSYSLLDISNLVI